MYYLPVLLLIYYLARAGNRNLILQPKPEKVLYLPISKGEIISLKNLKNRPLCQKRIRKFHKSVKQPLGYKRPY